jgi:hypothetical protein
MSRYLLPKGQMENYSVRKEVFPSESQSSPSQIPASQLATQVPDDSLGPSGDGTESMKALHTMRVKRKGGEEGDRIIKYIVRILFTDAASIITAMSILPRMLILRMVSLMRSARGIFAE